MIFDLHNDFPTVYAPERYKSYLEQCRVKNAVITGAIWTSEFKSDALARVKFITDSLRYKTAPQKCYIAIEDIGFLAEGDAYKKFDFGPYIYCSLTWNYNNAFAGGALDNGVLTEKGKSVIDFINASSCAVDLAHLNKRSFYSVLEQARKIVCSHTGFNSHQRSLDDGQIHAIIERGGVIGLCTVTAFTGASSCLEFEAIIDRFVQKHGVDNLAIGTDFKGSTDIPSDLADYGAISVLNYNLRKRGYGEDDIKKIFFDNATRIL
ncbi:MAG: hypothetical protein HDT28_07120 [Clostridiales bacterium]|nr:hypothetical protein [Clostridiales bacterium]